MKTRLLAILIAAVLGIAFAHAADEKSAKDKTAAAISAQKTCPVTGGKLGGMGEPYAHVYKQEGKSDRTIYFCCKACVKPFEKDPAKYLAKLDSK